MGVYVAVIEELRARFEAQLGSGNVLEAIKTVYVAKRQDVNFNVDLPILILDFEALQEVYSGQERKAGTINIAVFVRDKLTDEKAENLLYDTADSTGIVFLMEKIIDVANTSRTTGNFDPRLAQNAFESMKITAGGVRKISEAFIETAIFFELKLKEFIGNQRS